MSFNSSRIIPSVAFNAVLKFFSNHIINHNPKMIKFSAWILILACQLEVVLGRFINMHNGDPLKEEYVDMCLFCKKKRAASGEYYMGALRAEDIDERLENRMYSSHLVCEECLLEEFKKKEAAKKVQRLLLITQLRRKHGILGHDGESSAEPINTPSQGGSINTPSQGGPINTPSQGGPINTPSQEQGSSCAWLFSCPCCKMNFSCKNVLEYVKSIALGTKNESDGYKLSESIAIKLLAEVIENLDLTTILFLAGIDQKGDFDKFISFIDSNHEMLPDLDLANFASLGRSISNLLETEINVKNILGGKMTKPTPSSAIPQVEIEFGDARKKRMVHNKLYLESTKFPFPDNVFSDLQKYIKFVETLCNRSNIQNSCQVSLVNAKILSVIDQPNLPVKLAMGYFYPYILPQRPSSEFRKNDLIEELIKEYMGRYPGVHVKHEIPLENMVQFNHSCPRTISAAVSAYFNALIPPSAKLQSPESLKTAENGIATVLNLIDRCAHYVKTGQVHDAASARRMLGELLTPIISKLYQNGTTVRNLIRIAELGEKYSGLFCLRKLFDYKNTLLYGNSIAYALSESIVESFNSIVSKKELISIRKLIFLYQDAKLAQYRATLFVLMHGINNQPKLRSLALLTFVEYEIKEEENLYSMGTILKNRNPVYFRAYLTAVVMYAAKHISIFPDSVENLKIIRIMKFYRTEFEAIRKLYASGLRPNLDIIYMHAFGKCYNAYIEKSLVLRKTVFGGVAPFGVPNAAPNNASECASSSLSSSNISSHTIELVKLDKDNKKKMYRFLRRSIEESGFSGSKSMMLLTMKTVYHDLMRAGVNTDLTHKRLIRVVAGLIWSNISPLSLYVDWLKRNGGFRHAMMFQYLHYRYCLWKQWLYMDRIPRGMEKALYGSSNAGISANSTGQNSRTGDLDNPGSFADNLDSSADSDSSDDPVDILGDNNQVCPNNSDSGEQICANYSADSPANGLQLESIETTVLDPACIRNAYPVSSDIVENAKANPTVIMLYERHHPVLSRANLELPEINNAVKDIFETLIMNDVEQGVPAHLIGVYDLIALAIRRKMEYNALHCKDEPQKRPIEILMELFDEHHKVVHHNLAF